MAARFWVGGSGTWDASDTTHWASTSGGAGGASVPGPSDDVTLDANSNGTITINTNFSIKSLVFGAFVGTLDGSVNNNSPTLGSFSRNNSAVNTWKLGTGTWTFNGTTGNVFTLNYQTGATVDASGATMLFAAASTGVRYFLFNPNGGTYTLSTIIVRELGSGYFPCYLSYWNSSVTLGSFTFETGIGIIFGMTAYTFTTSLSFGGSAAHPIIVSGTGNYNVSLPNALSASNVAMSSILKAGAGSITLTDSRNCGGNSGVSISGPSAGGGLLVNPGLRGGML